MNINDKLYTFALQALSSDNLSIFLRQHKDYWNKVKHNIKSSTSSSREKLWLITHDYTIPKCEQCDNTVTWNIRKQRYHQFCSAACSNKSSQTKNKIKQTNIERYGVEHPTQSQSIQNKIKQTNTERYGGHPLQDQHVQNKIKLTNIERYGVERPAQNDVVKLKTKTTNQKKWGVDWVSQNNDIKQQQTKTLYDNYGVTVPMHSSAIAERQKKTQANNANTTCYSSQQHINPSNLNKLNSRQFLIHHHINQKLSLGEIGSLLQVDPETVRQRCIEFDIPISRFNQSTGERQIIKFLNDNNISNIQTNTRSVIAPYELDIYLPDYNLAIEYCGLYWHSDIHSRIDHSYHKNKHDLCKQQGIQLLTIFEDEWINRQHQVKNKILSLTNKMSDIKINARQCNIKSISKQAIKQFLNQYHIQGDGPGSIRYGLYHNDHLVAVMCFIKQKDNTYYLNRYATSANVRGGFTKLVNHFVTTHNPKQIISFADCRWSDGGLYKNNGWKLDKILAPDYYYVVNRIKRLHKFNFRRKNLPKLLNQFDPLLTEKQNCDNNGILRIWDCGKLRYAKNFS